MADLDPAEGSAVTPALLCMSIKQPWLDATIARAWIPDGKGVENRVTRRWRKDGTPVCPVTKDVLERLTRGPVPIGLHASSVPSTAGDRDPRVVDLFGERASRASIRGAILAVVELVDVHLDAAGCGCDHWADRGVWHLVWGRVWPLGQSVVALGSLGLPWTAPASVAEQVCAQLAVAAR